MLILSLGSSLRHARKVHVCGSVQMRCSIHRKCAVRSRGPKPMSAMSNLSQPWEWTLQVCGCRGMMMKLVHSRQVSSGSENTSPTAEKVLMSKSPPMKSMEWWIMCSRRRCKREIDASRFSATLPRRWAEQNVTMGDSTTDGRRSKPRATSAAVPHLSLLVKASEMRKTAAPETNVSLLSRMARSLPAVQVQKFSEMCGT